MRHSIGLQAESASNKHGHSAKQIPRHVRDGMELRNRPEMGKAQAKNTYPVSDLVHRGQQRGDPDGVPALEARGGLGRIARGPGGARRPERVGRRSHGVLLQPGPKRLQTAVVQVHTCEGWSKVRTRLGPDYRRQDPRPERRNAGLSPRAVTRGDPPAARVGPPNCPAVPPSTLARTCHTRMCTRPRVASPPPHNPPTPGHAWYSPILPQA